MITAGNHKSSCKICVCVSVWDYYLLKTHQQQQKKKVRLREEGWINLLIKKSEFIAIKLYTCK